jgi:hypothetical protein
MKPMAKEVVGFHPACMGKHSSLRPTFHPQGPDGPLTKPMAKEVVGFHPACAGKHRREFVLLFYKVVLVKLHIYQ